MGRLLACLAELPKHLLQDGPVNLRFLGTHDEGVLGTGDIVADQQFFIQLSPRRKLT